MKIFDRLGIKKGITSIIGSGGKTTLINTLAHELEKSSNVIITTTTHIFPFSDFTVLSDCDIDDVKKALKNTNVICIGNKAENGKMTKTDISLKELKEIADYVLVEADGSKNLPIKAHMDFEPVVDDCSDCVILVVGIDAVSKKVKDCVHRYELFCDIVGCGENDILTCDMIAKLINKENLADVVVINKADSKNDIENANKLSKLLDKQCFICSLKNGICECHK